MSHFVNRSFVLSALVAAFIGSRILFADTDTQDQGKTEDEAAPPAEHACETIQRLIDELRIDYVADSPTDVLAKADGFYRAVDEAVQVIRKQSVNTELLALNYVGILADVTPRRTGTVLHVGEGQTFPDLVSALKATQGGELILLPEGQFGFTDDVRHAYALGRLMFNDVSIRGAGSDKTTMSFVFLRANRLRIENLRIDCGDYPFLDLRVGGKIHVRDCEITGFNSGAGGSNALSGNDAVVLIERCEFEGLTGRGNRSGSQGGNAFDLRGDNLLFVRQSQFVDNNEIIRATHPCVFDGCISTNSTRSDFGIMPYGAGTVFLRDNRATVSRLDNAIEFEHATDNREAIEFVLGRRESPSPQVEHLARGLKLDRNLVYWIGLLLHEDKEVRGWAAERITVLAGEFVKIDEGMVPLADIAVDSEKSELAFGRLMNRYENVRDRLKWDGTQYQLEP